MTSLLLTDYSFCQETHEEGCYRSYPIVFGHLDTDTIDADATAFDIDTQGNLLMGGNLDLGPSPYLLFLSVTEASWAKSISLN